MLPGVYPRQRGRHVFCYTLTHMARLRTQGRVVRAEGSARGGRVRIDEECLELDVTSARELTAMRRLLGLVNGDSFAQPYLVEGPPGRFRLYVGAAAERVRTARGIQ